VAYRVSDEYTRIASETRHATSLREYGCFYCHFIVDTTLPEY